MGDMTTEQIKEQIIACQQVIIQAYLAERRLIELQKELERRKNGTSTLPSDLSLVSR